MRLRLVAKDVGSKGLKALASELSDRLGHRVLRVSPERVRPRRNRVYIHFPTGIDKVRQFALFSQHQVSCPAHATTLEGAKALDCKKVVVRTLVNASEGRGITIVPKEELNHRAPLYTAYVPKKKEFRVHVYNNQVIDVQEKRRRRVEGQATQEFEVRNMANGYVFCRDNVLEPGDLRMVALQAVNALGRTHGAVDVGFNEKKQMCFVLEVNSRPGLQGTTAKKYADAIIRSL